MASADFDLPVKLMLAQSAQMLEGDLAVCLAAGRSRPVTTSPDFQNAERL
jgi:hypothetical protein